MQRVCVLVTVFFTVLSICNSLLTLVTDKKENVVKQARVLLLEISKESWSFTTDKVEIWGPKNDRSEISTDTEWKKLEGNKCVIQFSQSCADELQLTLVGKIGFYSIAGKISSVKPFGNIRKIIVTMSGKITIVSKDNEFSGFPTADNRGIMLASSQPEKELALFEKTSLPYVKFKEPPTVIFSHINNESGLIWSSNPNSTIMSGNYHFLFFTYLLAVETPNGNYELDTKFRMEVSTCFINLSLPNNPKTYALGTSYCSNDKRTVWVEKLWNENGSIDATKFNFKNLKDAVCNISTAISPSESQEGPEIVNDKNALIVSIKEISFDSFTKKLSIEFDLGESRALKYLTTNDNAYDNTAAQVLTFRLSSEYAFTSFCSIWNSASALKNTTEGPLLPATINTLQNSKLVHMKSPSVRMAIDNVFNIILCQCRYIIK